MTPLVHVIDDDDGVRDSLAMSLGVRGVEVRTFASALSFLEQAGDTAQACVVTDVNMPEMTGLELLERMAGRLDACPVIVLTGQADVPMAVEALKRGASDFLEKPVSSDALFAAVTAALGRVSRRAEEAARRAEGRRRLEALTPRERNVFDGVVAGQSNKEIARALAISPRTVEAYRASLMVKMQADSLSDLVRMSLAAEEAR
ncbi:response regulator [Phenylobacterium sp. SCN 70-31]|uniref:response regulator transcription factor n=1 Tax=Phenylobacterium sp. SCN 70-31 TaxID=1660129 RepID=UPI00086E3867|nr:response regulator [Phenylobacterium sp. SCN 70-31]ODT89885.1 MAG: DNA-binding response regulator [Phenylobacterium sp. SCN 70-31]